MAVPTQAPASGTEIRPFRVENLEEQIVDLRRRIAATRWPSKELVADRSEGVQLVALQALARYWGTEYDFGRVEARLNREDAAEHFEHAIAMNERMGFIPWATRAREDYKRSLGAAPV